MDPNQALRDMRTNLVIGAVILVVVCLIVYRIMSVGGLLNKDTLRIEFPVSGTYSIKSDDGTIVSSGDIPATVTLEHGPVYTVTVKDPKASITYSPVFPDSTEHFPDITFLEKIANDTHKPKDSMAVASVYELAWGVPEDDAKALKWYIIAAHQGSGEADMKVATFYENGVGTDRDDQQAYNYYHEAATRGVPEAEVKMGILCRDGSKVAKLSPDKAEAVNWFKKAAAQGNEDAKAYLDAMGAH